MKEIIKEFFTTESVSYIEAGDKITFIETGKGGEGACTLKSTAPTLFINAKKGNFVSILKNQKCAEAAFLTLQQDNEMLAMLEMKSSLSKKEWMKVLQQYSGMYLCTKAVLGILQMQEPQTIKAYIAYRQEDITEDPNSYILNKVGVGQKDPVLEAWDTGEISLPHGKKAQLIKGQRDTEGNCDFEVM